MAWCFCAYFILMFVWHVKFPLSLNVFISLCRLVAVYAISSFCLESQVRRIACTFSFCHIEKWSLHSFAFICVATEIHTHASTHTHKHYDDSTENWNRHWLIVSDRQKFINHFFHCYICAKFQFHNANINGRKTCLHFASIWFSFHFVLLAPRVNLTNRKKKTTISNKSETSKCLAIASFASDETEIEFLRTWTFFFLLKHQKSDAVNGSRNENEQIKGDRKQAKF